MASSTPTPPPAAEIKPAEHAAEERPIRNWRKFAVPALVVLLAIAIIATTTWNWNGWEGGRTEQVTEMKEGRRKTSAPTASIFAADASDRARPTT